MDKLVQQKVSTFFSNYPQRSLAAGEILVFSNEDPTSVYYLIEGKVGQYDVSHKGQQLMVNVFKPPAFFPMSVAINKVPNQYLYEALDSVVMRFAPQADAIAFLKSEPDVLFDLLSRVYRGTDGLLRQNALLMEGNAQSLLIFELMVSCLRFGERGAKDGYKLAIKENELAALTGLARETVSRNLSLLKSKHLIRTEPGAIYIDDLDALRKVLYAEDDLDA